MKKEITKKEEFAAEVRNKLTMPLTVLNQILKGKKLQKENIKLAIKNLKQLLEVMQK